MAYFVRTSALHGFRSLDDTLVPLKFDTATDTLQVIGFRHHEIHAGMSFTASTLTQSKGD